MERKIGYARSASGAQGVDDQVKRLREAGCSRVYTDAGVSGLLLRRPGLLSVMETVQSGDTLVVSEMSRISLSTPDLLMFVGTLMRQHVEIETLVDPEEARSLQFLVNHPSPRVPMPGAITAMLHRTRMWLAMRIYRGFVRLKTF